VHDRYLTVKSSPQKRRNEINVALLHSSSFCDQPLDPVEIPISY
jgi:hypothetical protein